MDGDGFCVWLTGLSGAGKSTLALALQRRLDAIGRGSVVFDGDAVRSRQSTPLGFSRDDRHANVAAVARQAADLVQAGGVAICALMSPYAESRRDARHLIGDNHVLLVHVSTPLDVCEARDVKGLYARARRGEIRHVVGLDEPYEAPDDADVRIDTTASRCEDDVDAILGALTRRRLLGRGAAAVTTRLGPGA
jgi:sulfate adenylyltransferase